MLPDYCKTCKVEVVSVKGRCPRCGSDDICAYCTKSPQEWYYLVSYQHKGSLCEDCLAKLHLILDDKGNVLELDELNRRYPETRPRIRYGS